MAGDEIRRNQTADAQQSVPGGAGTARAGGGEGGNGGAAHGEIRWVGQQHLMAGFCGRADAAAAGAGPVVVRPVVLVQRPRGVVVRIGPGPAGGAQAYSAKAA